VVTGWVSLVTPAISVQQLEHNVPLTAKSESLNSVANLQTPVSVQNVSMKSVSVVETENSEH
jgi:hypothetical protein